MEEKIIANEFMMKKKVRQIKIEQDHATKMKIGSRMINVLMERYNEPSHVALELVGKAFDNYEEMADLEEFLRNKNNWE